MAATKAPFAPTQAFLLRAATGFDSAKAASMIGISSALMKKYENGEAEAPADVLESLRSIGIPREEGRGDFTFIDLFAGIGGMRRAFEGSGGKCVFTAEWNRHALETYVANHGAEHPIIGDITKQDAAEIPDHDLLVAGFPCFPAGTLVETDDRNVPIESLKVGDLVATHRHRLRPVLTVMERDGAPLYQVKVTGVPSFSTTDEHPFYVRRRTRSYNRATKRHDVSFGAPEWVAASELDSDCFAALPMDEVGSDDTRTEAFWYMVGRWLGDGWTVDIPRTEVGREGQRSKRAVICTAIDDCESLKTKIEEAGFHGVVSNERTIAKIHICNGDLTEFLKGFGKGAGEKQVPRWVQSLPKSKLAALWSGWLDADGHRLKGSKDKYEVTTVGRGLALSMARVARNAFGRVACIRRSKVASTTVIEGRTVNQHTQFKVTLAARNGGMTFIDDGFAWVKVKSVKLTGETARVYNVEVEEDNSYVAEGVVVHNCQPFSISGVTKKNALGRKHGFADETQGTLFFDVARIIDAKRPRMFMLENVKNLRDHDKGRTFEIIRRTLAEELGYTVSWQVMDSSAWVPQKRRRIFIVGVREGEAFDFDKVEVPSEGPKLGSILHASDEGGEGGRYADGGALAKYTLTDNLWRYLQGYAAKHAASGNGFGFGLVGPEDVARTLSARYGKDGSEILIRQEGRNPRRLTPRECARLMGFDEGGNGRRIEIPVSDAQAYRQFGNSVVVPNVRAIADVIAANLLKPLYSETKPGLERD
jgi:DNA (cytosine-5)-methyltransferase 1